MSEHAARRCLRWGLVGVLLGPSACRDDAATSGPGGDPSAGGSDGADAGADAGADDGTDDGELPPDPDFPDPGAMGPQGLRRQTIVELSNTLQLIMDVDATELAPLLDRLPSDSRTPFDTDYLGHEPSQPLVEGMVALVEDLAALVLADASRRDALLGCTPSGPSDEACLRQFIEHFGRLALRRPLTADELDEYAGFLSAAEEDGDFDVAVELALSALLLDGEFLYLVEAGEPTEEPNTVRLDDFAMASRLSFLLWGSGPDDQLLDLASEGQLADAGGVQQVALAMMDDPRSTTQLQRMHAMWLGYDNLAVDPTLGASLRNESDQLVARVLQDGRWMDLFTATESYLDATLAEHYGIELAGGQEGWIEYPDVRRGGLLSHGSFLAIGKKFSDTSPTERGKAVWTRLLCNELPPPPPDVDSGLPPPGNGCKSDIYDMRHQTECAACHIPMDGIGFGLENYGPAGEWRTTEVQNPDCSIDGYGEFPDRGEFAGPRALGQMLVETGQLQGCFARHFYQFAIGRAPQPEDSDAIAAIAAKFEATDDLAELLVTFVASDAFRHRVTLEVQ